MNATECACRNWTHRGLFPPAAFWPDGKGHHPACDHYTAPPGVEWIAFPLVPFEGLRPEAHVVFETWSGPGWIPEQLELEPADKLRAIEVLLHPYPAYVRIELRNASGETVNVEGRWVCRAKRSTVNPEAVRRVLDAIADETRQAR